MLTPEQQADVGIANDVLEHLREVSTHVIRATIEDLLAIIDALSKRRAVVCKTCAGKKTIQTTDYRTRPLECFHVVSCPTCNGTGATVEEV